MANLDPVAVLVHVRPNLINSICDNLQQKAIEKGIAVVADAAYNNAIASLAFLHSVCLDYAKIEKEIIDLIAENAELKKKAAN